MEIFECFYRLSYPLVKPGLNFRAELQNESGSWFVHIRDGAKIFWGFLSSEVLSVFDLE